MGMNFIYIKKEKILTNKNHGSIQNFSIKMDATLKCLSEEMSSDKRTKT